MKVLTNEMRTATIYTAVLYYLRQVDNLNSPEDNRKLQKTVMAMQKL